MSLASGDRGGRELGSMGPVATIDRAFGLARRGGLALVLPAWGGGALVAGIALFAFYVERIEGVTSLRALLALALVSAFGARGVMLVRATRRAVALESNEPLPDPRPLDAIRTAVVVGLGLWVWLWPLALAARAGPLGVVGLLLPLALRGATAPSWSARCAAKEEGGLTAFRRAAADQGGRRAIGVGTELALLVGALGLAINLYATTSVLSVLSRSFIGLDLGGVEAFLSLKNELTLLFFGALSLVLLEPLRAALAAIYYVDARAREDGSDLRAAVDEAIAHASARRGPSRGVVGASVAALILLGPALGAHAQDPPPAFPPPGEEAMSSELGLEASPSPPPLGPAFDPERDAADHEVREEVQRILSRSEFRDVDEYDGSGLRQLLARLFEWLLRNREPPELSTRDMPTLALPGVGFFLAMGGSILLGVLVFLVLASRRSKREAKAVEAGDPLGEQDPRERAPAAFIDDAAALAAKGRYLEALRSLYLASLVALDRRGQIVFDPHRTNWQYLRQIRDAELRQAFGELTRLFDHKWYGGESTSRADYERARALADSLVVLGDASRGEAA